MDTLSKIASLLTVFLSLFIAYKAYPVDQSIKELQATTAQLDLAIKKADAELKSLESSRKITFDLYTAAKDVLSREKRSDREEEAVRVLIEALADDPFRWKLLNAIANGAKNAEVKEKAALNSTFYEENEVVRNDTLSLPPPPGPAASNSPSKPSSTKEKFGGYNFDFFFCEEKRNSSEPSADKALQLKTSSDSGRWRKRLLPKEINAREGYRVSNNEIRFTPPAELPIAQAMQTMLAEKNLKAALHETSYFTPNYVSVFFCE